MANKFHRLLTDAELHRPERVGEGDPNQQSIADLVDGQYYQDTLTGDVWRYVLNQEDEPNSTWERLLAYDREAGTITNAQQTIDIRTSKIGELSAAIAEGDGVSGFNAYLYGPISAGEDVTIIDSANSSNTITLTVTGDVNAGDVTVSTQNQYTKYSFPIGSPIELEGSLMKSYAQADPTKIIRSLTLERDNRSFGVVAEDRYALESYSNVVINRPSNAINFTLRDNQYLRIYRVNGEGQFIRINGDQTVSSTPFTVSVDAFTADYDYIADKAYIEEPSWQSTTQISQTANTVSILSGTVSDLGTSVASINTRTGILESNITALASVNDDQNTSIGALTINVGNLESNVTAIASVNDDQNTSISTFSATANAAYAAANTSVKYASATGTQGAYIELIAGEGGSNITLSADQIDINGVVNFVNEESTTTINGSAITTGSITADQINVTDLFAQTINVGNVIRSTNFGASSGFAIYSNGDAIFRQVEVDGKIITDTGSSIDGTYVSNINAGNIVAGSIDANVIQVSNLNASLITAGSINASVIEVTDLNASEITSGAINASVINVTDLNASEIKTGFISGWEINDGFLQSNNDTIRLDSTAASGSHITLFDGDDYIMIDKAGIESFNDSLGSSQKRLYFEISRGEVVAGNLAPGDLANSEYVSIGSSGLNVYNLSATVSNDLTVGGNVQASYKSDDGTAGISGTFTFFDSAATLTNNVVVKNGIITQWTQS